VALLRERGLYGPEGAQVLLDEPIRLLEDLKRMALEATVREEASAPIGGGSMTGVG
jgi:hypothetical protein